MTKHFHKLLTVIILVLSTFIQAQQQYTDILKPQSVFTEAPDEIKARKSFMREWWFYEQRAFPEE
ncbi:MAG: hypothetical protein EHM44_10215, partial [Ignavibacteriales bacterium]